MIDVLYFEFGEMRIFSNFVLVVMKEGITVMPEHNDDLLAVSLKYYKNKPFGYITFRINSYAVNPLVYLKTSEIKNLVAFAVVSTDPLKIANLELEKRFLTKPLKHFESLDEAKKWVEDMIENSPDNF